jgi:hypothetical protein
MSDGRARPLTRTTPPGAWVALVSHFAHQLEPGGTIVTRNPMMKSTATILGGADGVAP